MSPMPSRALRSSRLVIPCLSLVAVTLLAASSWAAPCGVFVSVNGTDTPTCGLSVNSPCRTINYGTLRAAGEGATCVFVQAGTYDEVLIVVPGIGVTGGFDLNWDPGPYDMAGHQVLVNGGADNATGGTGEFLTVRAHTPGAESRLAELVLAGPNATGAVSLNGRSSYVVHVSGATLTLDHVRLIAGNGAPGLTGSAGLDASSLTPAPAGGLGGNGQEFAVSCDNTSRGPGGAAGINICASSPGSRNMNGGAGGPGGTMDTDCNIFNLNLDAAPGIAGNNAGFTSGSAGIGGPGGPANVFLAGGNGAAGISVNGAAGGAGSGGGLTGGYWYASMGGFGGTGDNGSGGGGGGGAGGNDDGTDAYGAGGGGGGAGGCAARGGGGGGGGGGSSFGLAAVNGASVMLQDCTVERGQAATGGTGGAGGQGQPGGVGGLGGAHPGAAAAGTGGHGAHGGHGGGGGGGKGGSSYAVLQTTGSSVVTSNLTVIGGSLGAGGAGGISAPGASAADDDGNDGMAGAAGQLGTTLTVVGPEPSVAARPAMARGSAAVCDFSCVLDASGPSAPVPLSFEGAVPNPIVKGSMVRFGLPEPATVRIEVFDLGGRRVRALCDGLFPGGMHAVQWDGALEGGGPARAGVYLLRFTALGASRTRSAIVVR